MLAFIFGLFGLVIGSFLNVVILRRGARTLGGRSSCMHCGHQLAALDLVPVFSYVTLRGRCRYCASRISPQYPLVEALTAVSFAFIGGAPIAFVLKLLALPIGALLLCIAVYDVRHTIIPDEWVYPLAILSLLFGTLLSGSFLANVVSGIAGAAPLVFLWLVSRGKWMGLGDGKIALAMGFLLGPWGTYIALTGAFVGGALFFVPLVFAARLSPSAPSSSGPFGLTMHSEVPLGPFLILACTIVWLLQIYGIPVFSITL